MKRIIAGLALTATLSQAANKVHEEIKVVDGKTVKITTEILSGVNISSTANITHAANTTQVGPQPLVLKDDKKGKKNRNPEKKWRKVTETIKTITYEVEEDQKPQVAQNSQAQNVTQAQPLPQNGTQAQPLPQNGTHVPPTTQQPIKPAEHFKPPPFTQSFAFFTEIIAQHQVYRKEHNLPELKWSRKLARQAQKWAQKIAETGKFQHSGAKGVGENIAMAQNGAEQPNKWYIDLWGAEKKFFVPGKACPNFSSDGKWTSVGHYTQLIWRKTTEVGCGRFTKGDNTVFVCNYNPAGNVEGQTPL